MDEQGAETQASRRGNSSSASASTPPMSQASTAHAPVEPQLAIDEMQQEGFFEPDDEEDDRDEGRGEIGGAEEGEGSEGDAAAGEDFDWRVYLR